MKHYLVLTLISALPLYLVRFRVVGIPVNLWEVLLVCAVAITAAQALRRKELRLFFLLPREKLFRWGVGLLGAGLALSLLLNPTAHGLGIFKGWFVAVFVFFLLARHQRAQAVFYVYSASAAAVSVIALGYAFFGSLTFDGRLAAFFESPNHLAMYIAPAFLIIAGEILNPKSEIRNKSKVQNPNFLHPESVLII